MSKSFIAFVNHLLTFDTQYNLIINKSPQYINSPFRFNINSSVLNALSVKAKEIFDKEPNVLEINVPIYIFGDIHGQFQDFIRFLKMTGLPPNNKFLFMGDYVDRGSNSVEVLCLLFALKILYPRHVYILRGNHECKNVNMNYGFYQECCERFNDHSINGHDTFMNINNTLQSIPLAAVINKKVFCVHGGLSPNLKKVSDINKINRFQSIPDEGLLCDLLWSDPKSDRNEWTPSSRGVSYNFNEKVIDKFLEDNELELICRAHQMVVNGFSFFNNNKLVTIFSAPNYCGSCGNDGAVMKINNNLECSFMIIKPVNNKSKISNNNQILSNNNNNSYV